ncbi:alpha/beta hydrolase family protein [Bdellovibrio sp. HCB-162]|uniref:alpha/beta hydrolase family protein n=1 Tax=Bdellovibrio sp. HCB-162 TaxID=3394234 RepID=UPI0039BCDB25
MEKISFNINNLTCEALRLNASSPSQAVLFAAGGGGNPERHLPLLKALSESGCTVIAPYFERLASPRPSVDELRSRVNSLQSALNIVGESNLSISGIGHSIGATLLLALAGGEMWMKEGQKFPVTRDERIKKLVLFTPPTGFFQAPKSLENVHASIQAWAGSLDTFTPPQQLEILKEKLSPHTRLETRIIEGAGHFSFMNTLPPNVVDTMKDRELFLTDLAAEVCNFVMA